MTAPQRLRISAYAALSQAVMAVNIAFEDRCASRRLPRKIFSSEGHRRA